MKTNRFTWGAFFILAAIFVIVNQLNFFSYINFWTLLLTVFLIPSAIIGLIQRNFFQLFLSTGILLIVYRKYWNFFFLSSISSWSIMLAAVLLAFGFSSIFKSEKNNRYSGCSGQKQTNTHYSYDTHTETNNTEYTEHINDNDITCNVSLGSCSKYIHSNNLQNAFLSCNLGDLKVFFDNAIPHPSGANINVDCSLGAVALYIPRTWNVALNIDSTLSGVTEHGRPDYAEGPIVSVSGSVQLGGIEIYYV